MTPCIIQLLSESFPLMPSPFHFPGLHSLEQSPRVHNAHTSLLRTDDTHNASSLSLNSIARAAAPPLKDHPGRHRHCSTDSQNDVRSAGSVSPSSSTHSSLHTVISTTRSEPGGFGHRRRPPAPPNRSKKPVVKGFLPFSTSASTSTPTSTSMSDRADAGPWSDDFHVQDEKIKCGHQERKEAKAEGDTHCHNKVSFAGLAQALHEAGSRIHHSRSIRRSRRAGDEKEKGHDRDRRTAPKVEVEPSPPQEVEESHAMEPRGYGKKVGWTTF